MKSAISEQQSFVQTKILAQARADNHPYVFGDPSTDLGMLYASNLPVITADRMKRFTRDLASVDNSKKIDYKAFRSKTTSIGFLFSNELGVEKVPNFLSTCPLQTLPDETIRVAMLVGESNFLTLLFTLSRHAQHILMVDIDPLVIAHNQYLLQCLRDCKNVNEFQNLYFDQQKNPVLKANLTANSLSFYQGNELKHREKNMVVNDAILARFLLDKIRSFGKEYFLADDSSFYCAKTTAEHLTFSFVQLDLFNEEQVRKLKMTLEHNQAQITVCNLTNLIFHDNNQPCRTQLGTWYPKGRFEKNIKLLIEENANIPTLFSVYTQADNLLLQNAQAQSITQAINFSKLDILILNLGSLGDKYDIAGDNFDINKLFRTVAAKGRVDELAYILQFASFHKQLSQFPHTRAMVTKDKRYNIDLNDNAGESGRTALHFAVIFERIDNLGLLLAEPDIRRDIKDKKGNKTAEQYAEGEILVLFSKASHPNK